MVPAAASAPTPAEPTAPLGPHPDPRVEDLLEETSVSLTSGLVACSWEMITAAQTAGRSTLMRFLKEHGVLGVTNQQKLANAVGGAIRNGRTKSGLAVVHPCVVRRERLAQLPPHRRLTTGEIAANVPKVLPGEWFALPFPINFPMLDSEEFGASFLTKAFHAAGSLPRSNSVIRIQSLKQLPLQGDDAQGGAGIKAIICVEYAQPDASLHDTLFVKMPWLLEDGKAHWRALLSSSYGDGDGRELATYVFLEDLLPVRIPKFYFADINRSSTNYILITECIPYGEADGLVGDAAIGKMLAKSGKYQDDRLAQAHEYYYALMRSFARIAAADKLGAFDSVISFFAGGLGAAVPKKLQITEARRGMMARRAESNFDSLIKFATVVAPHLFPPELSELGFLKRTKQQCMECSCHFDEASAYAAERPEFVALTHVNLQVDNGFFWRTAGGDLEAGLLDWYNCTRAPFAAIFMGCLSGAEPDVLSEHLEGFMRCFAAEYAKAGGPTIDPLELLLQFKLLYVSTLVNGLSFIESDIYKEGPPEGEWKTIMSKEDSRVMGRWNVRCRVIAILQCLAFWKMQNLHKVFMEWVKSGCGNSGL